jgi:hypothetical protein
LNCDKIINMSSNTSPVKVPPSLQGHIRDERVPREKPHFDFSGSSIMSEDKVCEQISSKNTELIEKNFQFNTKK